VKISRNLTISGIHRGKIHKTIRELTEPDINTQQMCLNLRLMQDTLIVWGGEFGRTIYCQGALTKDNYGRDHHPRCFISFMAGAGVNSGTSYGATDDFSYNITENQVHVHDLNATLLHL